MDMLCQSIDGYLIILGVMEKNDIRYQRLKNWLDNDVLQLQYAIDNQMYEDLAMLDRGEKMIARYNIIFGNLPDV